MVSNISTLVQLNKVLTKAYLVIIGINFLYILTLRMSTGFKAKKYNQEDRQISVYYEMLKLCLFISLGLRVIDGMIARIIAFFVLWLGVILATAGVTSHLFLCFCPFEYSFEGKVISSRTFNKAQKIKSNRNISIIFSIIAILVVKLILFRIKSLPIFIIICAISIFLITFSCNLLRRSCNEIVNYFKQQ